MPLKGTVRTLTSDVRRLLDLLVIDPQPTIDDIVSTISAVGGQVSRSAVGRYRKRFEDEFGKGVEAEFRRRLLLAEELRRNPKPRVRIKAGRG
ncbi:phage protein Gp27 family protein [Elioraea sp.]|uniref:phage protein Gp27 family protein n=1 Tax=Elioraea sp. TaxID=2185103 RepID=UPI0025C51393|nr:phage protein Gp27 family protein [Elioraea sp.]